MLNKEIVKSKIILLSEKSLLLKKLGGPENNSELFEEIFSIEDDILKSFGLPENSKFAQILKRNNIPSNHELEEMIFILENIASEYLLAPTETSISVLTKAKDLKLDPFGVLPELKIITHIYSIFVYEEILLKERDTSENVLKELELFNTDDSILFVNKLIESFRIAGEQNFEKQNISELKYINQFILSDYFNNN
ncbi:MAG: hypothetical protein ACK48W_02845 [Bacteroidota bacterium]